LFVSIVLAAVKTFLHPKKKNKTIGNGSREIKFPRESCVIVDFPRLRTRQKKRESFTADE
jgi:hypothetical protein